MRETKNNNMKKMMNPSVSVVLRAIELPKSSKNRTAYQPSTKRMYSKDIVKKNVNKKRKKRNQNLYKNNTNI